MTDLEAIRARVGQPLMLTVFGQTATAQVPDWKRSFEQADRDRAELLARLEHLTAPTNW